MAQGQRKSGIDAPAVLDPWLDARLEAVCRKGCREVRQEIARLERGEEIVEARGLGVEERGRLLAELKAIMAVYGETCRID